MPKISQESALEAAAIKPKQSLVTFMRDLRKVLSGMKVERVKDLPFTYLVEDRIRVSLNYYCNWQENLSKEDKAKVCHPASVTVSPDTAKFSKEVYGDGSWRIITNSAIFRTRTIQSRHSGEFNFEPIAVAVTKGLEAFDKYAKDYRARAQRDNAVKKSRQKAVDDLLKDFGKGRFADSRNYTIRSLSKATEGSEHAVQIWVDNPNIDSEPDDLRYGLEVEGMSKAQLDLFRGVLFALTQKEGCELAENYNGNANGDSSKDPPYNAASRRRRRNQTSPHAAS